MSSAGRDRPDVVDRRGQRVWSLPGRIHGPVLVPADAAEPAGTFADLAHGERLDWPVRPHLRAAVPVLVASGHVLCVTDPSQGGSSDGSA